MNAANPLLRAQTLTENHLREVFKRFDVAPELQEAMRYSLFAPGKRVRPALVFATLEALGANVHHGISSACALEMIHTYSLIHDDLPAMDDDSLRRGRPTNHVQFSEGTAILAGDALLTESFGVLTDLECGLSSEQKLNLVSVLAKHAGVNGMVGGQFLDLYFENKPCSLEELQSIHVNKTGALLCASVQMGGICAGASKEDQQRLETFGSSIGLAFQIADDILDLTQSSQTLGKNAKSDEKKNKATYPALMGLEKSKLRANELLNTALSAIEKYGENATVLKQLAHLIVERTS